MNITTNDAYPGDPNLAALIQAEFERRRAMAQKAAAEAQAMGLSTAQQAQGQRPVVPQQTAVAQQIARLPEGMRPAAAANLSGLPTMQIAAQQRTGAAPPMQAQAQMPAQPAAASAMQKPPLPPQASAVAQDQCALWEQAMNQPAPKPPTLSPLSMPAAPRPQFARPQTPGGTIARMRGPTSR